MLKIKKNIKKYYWFIFIGVIILYIVIVFSSLVTKYNNFGYTGMDLAIFNQVSFNSAQGNLFHFTIHPNSYLGDHFTPFLILLLPPYSLFQSPLTLLLLQTLIIAFCTIPIYLIAKHNLNKTWALILPILWLLNPIVLNINFFEFHLLPFAIFFLLFSIYFYQKENLQLFTIFSLLSLTVREDVFLVIFMFGILALLEKRKIKWIILPIILSIAWFTLAQSIIVPHNPLGAYKYIPYYNWLGGNSMLEIIKNWLTHPLAIIQHLLLFPNNIIMVIALLTPFLFIPICKPKYLLLSFLVYLQFALTQDGGGDIVFKTHYAALFLPGIIASFILGLKLIYNQNETKSETIKILRKNKSLILIIIILSNIYLLFTLSPFRIQKQKNQHNINNLNQKIKQELLEYIPKYEAIASSYEFLPHLSNRPKLYSLNYAWGGYKQLSYSPYKIPSDLQYLYVNFEDVLKYEFQYNQKDLDQKYKDSYSNWTKLFEEYNLSPLKIIDTYGIWHYNSNLDDKTLASESKILYEIINNQNIKIENPQDVDINNEIKFLGWNQNEISKLNKLGGTELELLPISLYFKKIDNKIIENNYQLQFSIGEYSKIYPLVYGFYPSSQWQKNEVIKINYWFLIPPSILKEKKEYQFNLIKLEGGLTLDKNLSIIRNNRNLEILKPDINIVW